MPAAIPEFETRSAPRSADGLRMTLAPASTLVPQVRNSALFEAGSHTRRTTGWRAPTTSANQGVLGSLTTLRDRSRAAARNDGYAKAPIDRLVTNIIGTGIKPMSLADDPAFREQLHKLWLAWTDECDADGLFDFYGLQALAVRCWLEGGEAFIRLRQRLPGDGLSVPLQLQVLEPELCPHTHNAFMPPASRIRAGIEFSAIGQRVAYYFHPSRPELDDYDASQLRRVPADSVCHLYLPLRPGQLRGLPQLTAALIQLYELDKFSDATLLRQQLANLFAAFIKRPQTTGLAEEQHPLTGETIDTSNDGKDMLSLEPGIFQELQPGEEVQFSAPPAPNGYAEFMRQSLMNAAIAADVPYEVVTHDMRGVNDRTVRVILHEFRRRVTMLQHQIVAYQFCRRTWRAFMDRVFLSSALPMPLEYLNDPAPWARVKWVPQGWPYIHPLQDVQAAKEEIRCGLASRSAKVSERGEDAEAIDAEQAADNTRADELGLTYDSDGRQSKNEAPVATENDTPESQPAGAAA